MILSCFCFVFENESFSLKLNRVQVITFWRGGLLSRSSCSFILAVHGPVGPFTPGSEDWASGRAYIERLYQYFVANAISDAEKQRAILLSVCGATTYQLIRDFFQTRPPEKTYPQFVELVTNQYSPKPSAIMQRWKFNSRVQLENESISVYVAALRQLSEFCEYGDTLHSML